MRWNLKGVGYGLYPIYKLAQWKSKGGAYDSPKQIVQWWLVSGGHTFFLLTNFLFFILGQHTDFVVICCHGHFVNAYLTSLLALYKGFDAVILQLWAYSICGHVWIRSWMLLSVALSQYFKIFSYVFNFKQICNFSKHDCDKGWLILAHGYCLSWLSSDR